MLAGRHTMRLQQHGWSIVCSHSQLDYKDDGIAGLACRLFDKLAQFFGTFHWIARRLLRPWNISFVAARHLCRTASHASNQRLNEAWLLWLNIYMFGFAVVQRAKNQTWRSMHFIAPAEQTTARPPAPGGQSVSAKDTTMSPLCILPFLQT
eukprot:SAG31_NODE_1024_length_10294_cov_7.215400_11_plen_151_part_00